MNHAIQDAYWYDKHFSFFCHRDCEAFPCHEGVPEEQFNCLFCYCPLYALGERCGGQFTYTASGIKDCSSCTLPHERDNYGRIIERFSEVAELAARKNRDETEKSP